MLKILQARLQQYVNCERTLTPENNTGFSLVTAFRVLSLAKIVVHLTSPESLVQPDPLWPKQLHLHIWPPHRGKPKVLQDSLKSKPQWMIHIQKWE